MDRLGNLFFIPEKIEKKRKKGWGFIEKLYAKDKDVVLVRWYHNKSVYIALTLGVNAKLLNNETEILNNTLM